jgi:hypothetical protein
VFSFLTGRGKGKGNIGEGKAGPVDSDCRVRDSGERLRASTTATRGEEHHGRHCRGSSVAELREGTTKGGEGATPGRGRAAYSLATLTHVTPGFKDKIKYTVYVK